jgi:hypothetical protein
MSVYKINKNCRVLRYALYQIQSCHEYDMKCISWLLLCVADGIGRVSLEPTFLRFIPEGRPPLDLLLSDAVVNINLIRYDTPSRFLNVHCLFFRSLICLFLVLSLRSSLILLLDVLVKFSTHPLSKVLLLHFSKC